MSNKLKSFDRNILNYRPQIEFVEPELEAEVPITPEPIETPSDVKNKWNDLDKMAKAGKLLAEALQSKVDQKVESFAIGLDPNVDIAVINAIERKFPGADTTKITYSQYKECREAMRDRGDQLARNIGPDWTQVKEIRANANQSQYSSQSQLGMLDINSPEAKNGTLFRPDLQTQAQVIEPLDINKVQEDLLRKLMNLLWKKFIKPVITPLIPFPLNKAIPDEIA